jgi:ATP-dependent helicase/nuclease subunit B
MKIKQGNIINIPANYHFLFSLLSWLQESFCNKTKKIKIFLPNKRSATELNKIIKEKNLDHLFTNVKALSDLKEEDFFEIFTKEQLKDKINSFSKIKILSEAEYLIFIAQELRELKVFGENLSFDHALKIAVNFKNLFNQLENEGIEIIDFDNIDDSNLSLHRQVSIDLIKDFYSKIKNSLIKNNIFFNNSYQNFLIKSLSELIDQNGLKDNLIIAGSTGSNAFTKCLIESVLKQENGYVILSSFYKNKFFEPKENHPQFLLNKLLNFLKIENVNNFEKAEFLISKTQRQDFIEKVMLPYEQSIKWQQNFTTKEAIEDLEKNFLILEAVNEIEEARGVAQIIKKNFYQRKKIGLISNNKNFLSFVKLELRSFEISFDDSRRVNLIDSSKLLQFLILITEFVTNSFESNNFLSVIKHQFCFLSQFKEITEKIEIEIFRTPKKNDYISFIKQKLLIIDDQEIIDFILTFLDLASFDYKYNFLFFIKNLIKIFEHLTKKNFEEFLIQEDPQIKEFFNKLSNYQNIKIESKNFLEAFKVLLQQINSFEKSNQSLIQILSPIEARLLNFDLVIISSLNEGEFPQIKEEDWLGKKIKRDLGIEDSLKKIGQSAFDFSFYLSSPSVVLSYSTYSSSASKSPSHFLLKFMALYKKINANIQISKNIFIENVKDYQEEIVSIFPKIEKKYFPKIFSVSEICQLILDPYSIYRKKVLQIEELKEIDYTSSKQDFGSFVHNVLELVVKNKNQNNYLSEIKTIFNKYFFTKEDWLIWWPRFEEVFEDFLQINQQFDCLENYSEVVVELKIGNILVIGKIDRLVKDEFGYFEIFDYKTGESPEKKDVVNFTKPQLLMLAQGFVEKNNLSKSLQIEEIKSLNYWKLSYSEDGVIKKISDNNLEIQQLIFSCKIKIEKLLNSMVKD